jgi:hypothetical protein
VLDTGKDEGNPANRGTDGCFSAACSGDDNIDSRSHGVTPVYLFVSKIFNITLQDR